MNLHQPIIYLANARVQFAELSNQRADRKAGFNRTSPRGPLRKQSQGYRCGVALAG